MAIIDSLDYEYIDINPQVGGDTYRHKLKDVIGRALIAPTETSNTASMAHVPDTDSGYFIYNNSLYCATINIAQGDTIVPGTNCKTVTVGGELGKGISTYVHIKYAQQQPTQDSDMSGTPGPWMGVYTGTSATAPTHYTDYVWNEVKGPQGDDYVLTTADKTEIAGIAANELQPTITELNNKKADKNGDYPNMTVGNAEQLLSTVGPTDKVPYLLRTSGGGVTIGDREVDKIIGGTVAWNQLVDENTEAVTLTSGRRYAACIGGLWSIGTSDGTAISVTGGTDQVFDLSVMFGSAIADYIYSLETATPGAGVAWFRKLFPKDYYAYDAGTLRSVQVSAHKMVGFNQWDITKDTAGKTINASGEVVNNSSMAVSDYIKVVPNATYYLRKVAPSARAMCISYYDADKNYISCSYISGSADTDASGTKTMPSNAHYARICRRLVTTDVCFNLSWDGERDGEFEPYIAHTYALDSDLVLRGVPKLDANNRLYYDGDTYESDGKVTRKYGIVDLGTLDWQTESAVIGKFYANYNPIKLNAKIINPKGWQTPDASIPTTTLPDKSIRGTNSQVYLLLRIVDSAYSGYTAAQFKTAMTGVYIVFPLATPTTESADPYPNPQIVDDFGTEQYIDAGDRDVEIPVGHDTFYPENLRKKIEGLPWNFDNLIAPTEETYIATQPYSTRDMFIVNNILYRAKTSIANGATITPGTNCEQTTLAAITMPATVAETKTYLGIN